MVLRDRPLCLQAEVCKLLRTGSLFDIIKRLSSGCLADEEWDQSIDLLMEYPSSKALECFLLGNFMSRIFSLNILVRTQVLAAPIEPY